MKSDERAVRRVSYLELDRAARTHDNARRALAEYHELIEKKTRPVAHYSPKTGYTVQASALQTR